MKKLFSISNLILAVAIGFILYQFYLSTRDGSKLISNGNVHLVHNEYELALDAFHKALQEIANSNDVYFFETGMTFDKSQNRIKAWHGIGCAYAGLKEYKYADEYLSKVLQENYFYTASKLKRAWVLYMLGDFERAAQDHTDMLQSAPNSFYGLYNRGNVYLKLKEYKSAIADYTKAVSICNAGIQRPESLYIKNTLARVLATCPEESLRNGAQAVEIANTVVSKAKDNFTSDSGITTLAGFYDTLAAGYAASGQFDAAVETMNQAISLINANQTASKDTTLFQSHLSLYEQQEPLIEEFEPIYFR